MKVYSGRSVAPRREPVVYHCTCGERFATEVWRAISAEDAALRTRLIEGDLNRVRCPRCDAASDVQVSVLFHDPAARRLILVAPTSERHRELSLRAELFTTLAADGVPPPDYVLGAELVFGAAGLSAQLARASVEAVTAAIPIRIGDDATSRQPTIEPEPTRTSSTRIDPTPAFAVPDLVAPPVAPTKLATEKLASEKLAPEPAADPVARGEAEHTHPRATVNVPDPRTAVVERWIAARESATALFVDDRVVVCAALPAQTLEHFVAREGKRVRVSLRPQLHRMATFPLLVLTLVSGEDGERPDDTRVVHVPLDLSRAAHRVSLDQLQKRCAIELELFDSEYLPVVSVSITAPFEDHLRHLVGEAKAAMEKLPVATRDFERARRAFLDSGYDRLGRTVIDLPTLDEVMRGGTSQVRGALALIARWSEAAAEGYLLEIRGFPLSLWRKLMMTTVRRAVEFGLFVPRALAERVVRRNDDALDLPPWPDLVELLIRRFAELSARLKPNDLVPVDEAANWELLLREAEALALPIDAAIVRLADAAFSRVGGRPSRRARAAIRNRGAAAPVEPLARGTASQVRAAASIGAHDETDQLLVRLEDRDGRLEAALALAARKEVRFLAPLFVVLRRVSRAEAALLLPHLVAFGNPAERWLIEGLRSRKAYLRQGCALALGHLATPLAIDALARLLFEEPTEIWTEIARAIGDVGAPAIMPLAARLRELEGDARERIIHALAHIVARASTSGLANNRAAIEALATGRDALVANAARRALVLAPQVLTAHEAVRKDRREQTLVRAFTRRFYDVLEVPAGGASDADIAELDSEDLLALDDEEQIEDELSDVDDEIELEPLESSVNPDPVISAIAPLLRTPGA